MKLQKKFFLVAICLFFLYSLCLFIIPPYFLKKEEQLESQELTEAITQKNQQLLSDHQKLLKSELNSLYQKINSFLFILNKSPPLDFLSLNHTASPSTPPNDQNVWKDLVELASYDPRFGFLQIDSLDNSHHFTLTPSIATLYPVTAESIEGQKSQKVLFEHQEIPYLGLPYTTANDQYLILFPWDMLPQAQQEQERIDKTLAGITLGNFMKMYQGVQANTENISSWLEKIDMLQILASLVDPTSPSPVGIAKIGSEQTLALLKAEAMTQHPLFNAEKYYASHHPVAGDFPLAQNYVFLTDTPLLGIFLGNTLKTPSFYFTLGTAINPLLQELALALHSVIFIHVKDAFWLGFTSEGVVYKSNQPSVSPDEKRFKEMQLHLENIKESPDVFTLDHNIYHILHLSLLPGELELYSIVNQSDEAPFAKLVLANGKHLARKMSYEIFILSFIGIAVIFMIAMQLVSRYAIYPLRVLSHATKDVLSGDYMNAQLPNMGKRKDEIADLVFAFDSMIQGLAEKEKIRGVLNKVISKDIADEILKSNIQLGGEDRYLTVLFADIRHFTELTHNMTPQQTIEMLNTVMTKLTQIIEAHGGVIDKYVGDQVMAIFGAPVNNPRHAFNAVSSGISMVQTMIKWNEGRTAEGKRPIRIGVGIHSGWVVAGNMGATDRLNYTVLGNNVNLAARLCQQAQEKQVLISEITLKEPGIIDGFVIERQPDAQLKGFTTAVPNYRILDFQHSKDS